MAQRRGVLGAGMVMPARLFLRRQSNVLLFCSCCSENAELALWMKQEQWFLYDLTLIPTDSYWSSQGRDEFWTIYFYFLPHEMVLSTGTLALFFEPICLSTFCTIWWFWHITTSLFVRSSLYGSDSSSWLGRMTRRRREWQVDHFSGFFGHHMVVKYIFQRILASNMLHFTGIFIKVCRHEISKHVNNITHPCDGLLEGKFRRKLESVQYLHAVCAVLAATPIYEPAIFARVSFCNSRSPPSVSSQCN